MGYPDEWDAYCEKHFDEKIYMDWDERIALVGLFWKKLCDKYDYTRAHNDAMIELMFPPKLEERAEKESMNFTDPQRKERAEYIMGLFGY